MKIQKTIALTMALLVTTVILYAQDYSFKEHYKVSSPAQLTLSTSDGNVEVSSTTGSEIEVQYIVRRKNALLQITRQELEKEADVEVISTGSSLKITIKQRNNYTTGFFNQNQINVGFKVSVPKTTACDIHTSDGNIMLSGVTSSQQCKTSDGNITVSDINGDLTSATSDGHIQISNVKGAVMAKTSDGNISLKNITGNTQMGTSDGNITLSTVTGDVAAKTSNGHITFSDVSGSLTASTSDGNIKGNFVSLKKELDARTGDGNIVITVPSHLGMDLDIRGESLTVPLENFSGSSDEKSIKGKTNGGGIPVSLSTSDGNVTLSYNK